MTECVALFAQWRTRVDARLNAALDTLASPAPRLLAAMRHATLQGGKRLRPLLVYAAGTACGADVDVLDAPAAAVELIHAYSLVHDDLPAMDDDVLRRGQPTVHVAFDEATAVLAGDALQTLAFEVLATATSAASPERTLAMVTTLARAAGAAGMCGGQSVDIDATGVDEQASLQTLEHLHACKTGALFRACVVMGAQAAGAPQERIAALETFAQHFGLAFQIRDDVLDVEGDAATLGKTAGKDAAAKKLTFPALLGLDATYKELARQQDAMLVALAPFPQATALRALAELSAIRNY